MPKIVITIETAGPNEVYWKSLARSLREDYGFDTNTVGDLKSLPAFLTENHSDVLLLEVPQREFSADFSRYYANNPDMAIVGIDPEGVETIVRMRDVGQDLIARIVRSVTQPSNLDDKTRHEEKFHLLGKREVQLLADGEPDNPKARRKSTTGHHTWEILTWEREPLVQWLEICLHQLLLGENGHEHKLQLRGPAAKASFVRQLLGAEYAGLDTAQLASRRSTVERLLNRDSSANDSSLTTRFVCAANAFALNGLDRLILALALSPEIDGRFALVYGYLNDDYTRRRPSASHVAQVLLPDEPLAATVLRRLNGVTQLAAMRLVAVDGYELPDSEAGLVPAADITSYLLSERVANIDYGAELSLIYPPADPAVPGGSTRALVQRLLGWQKLANENGAMPPAVQLEGNGANAIWMRSALESARCRVVRLTLMVDDDAEALIEQARLAARTAILHGAVVFVDVDADRRSRVNTRPLRSAIRHLRNAVKLVVVHGATALAREVLGRVWIVRREPPGTEVRAAIWLERATALSAPLPEENARAIATVCQFLEPEIDATLNLVGASAGDLVQLKSAMRRVSCAALPSAVKLVDAQFTWKDIALPEEVLRKLHQLPIHVMRAHDVLDHWGFRKRMPYGNGVAALFSGPSGTGKTMAAQIIARDLGVELFKVDLSQTVSKYIGETEKALDKVFRTAEEASAVLLLDECEALLGKRTETRDSHDRYANIEVAYLLQRMEEFAGLAILTTNFRQNIDAAFMRRLRYVCEFPMPDARLREKIWSLAFPPDAPLSDNVSFGFLANRLELPGGSIQQIAIRAAFLAIESGDKITADHIVEATREELAKLGILNAEQTLAGMAA